MSGYTQVFGGSVVYPSDISYLSLALTADTTLQWPLEASTGNNLVARIIDVTPTGAFSVIMPPADQTGVGQVTQFTNLGPSTITIEDNNGGTLLSIAQGLTFTLYLTDNSDAAGTWRSFQAGASTAQAQASDLAGLGLVAQGSVLSQSEPVTLFNNDFTLGAANRAAVFVWTGGLGTLTLPSASAVGNNWFVSVRNNGEGDLTIDVPGSEDINGAATLVLRPEDSAIINTDGTDFFTVGYGQQAVFAFDYTSIDLTGQSSPYILTGAELNRIAYKFVGTLTTNIEVELPNTIQQYWVSNDTTGGSYTLAIGATGQSPYVDIPRGARGIYYCDGATVVKADTASISLPIAIGDGGTGANTAGGALINLGGTSVGIGVFNAANEAAARLAIGAVIGTNVQAYDADLAALAANSSNGLWARTGAGTGSVRTITGTANEITATNGDGVSGNPTLSLPASLTFTGKTITGGAFGSATYNGLTVTATTGTLTITNGKTLSASNSLTFAGTDGSTLNIGTGGTLGTAAYVATGTSGATIPLLNAANTFSALQTFNGSTSVMAAKLLNAKEAVTISATAATGTINYDITTQSVLYYTSNAAANWTVNLRASSGTSLDAAMSTGESVTVAFLVTQGATAYFNNVVQVDGTAVGVTTKWQSFAPTSGRASSIDAYTYTVVKTGAATFTVFASQASFV
jgi:hypothetical protein